MLLKCFLNFLTLLLIVWRALPSVSFALLVREARTHVPHDHRGSFQPDCHFPGFPDSSVGNESDAETPVQFLGWEDSLEKGQATHSSILGLPLWLSW